MTPFKQALGDCEKEKLFSNDEICCRTKEGLT